MYDTEGPDKTKVDRKVYGALTWVAALRGRVFVAEEELDLLLSGAPLLQVLVHHVFEGDGSLWGTQRGIHKQSVWGGRGHESFHRRAREQQAMAPIVNKQ